MLAISAQAHLLDHSPVLRRAVALRNPYVDPLHAVQVEMLRRWRGRGRRGAADNDRLLSTILRGMNSMPAGVQTFG